MELSRECGAFEVFGGNAVPGHVCGEITLSVRGCNFAVIIMLEGESPICSPSMYREQTDNLTLGIVIG